MNFKITAIVASIVLVVVGYGAYRFGAMRGSEKNAAQSALIDPATGKRVLYWHDPMVSGQRFDKPGKSPFMDMPLVPVFADDAPGPDARGPDAAVTVDSRVQQRLGVRIATVKRVLLNSKVTAAGNVEYNERDVALVQARASGFIEKLAVRTPLQTVSVGQVLAELYVPDWVAAQEEYLAVTRMQSSARDDLLAAASQRLRLVGMTDEQIAEVAVNKTVHARLQVRSPIAGVVSELTAREGMTVMNGAPLFRINGVETLWLYAEIPEAQLNRIKQGAHVTAIANALPDVILRGSVLTVLPEVSTETRTAKARIELENHAHTLSAGMFVTATIDSVQRMPVLAVPSEAVIVTGKRSVAIVVEDGGRFRPVVIETGNEAEGVIEIRGGLEEGQRVVTSAQFLIDSEASLKATAERMTEATPLAPSTGHGERK